VNYTPPIEVTFVNGDDASLNFNPTLPAPPQNNWPFGQFCFSTTSVGAILGTVDITVGGTFSGLSGSTPFQLYASNTNNYGSASAIGSGVAESGGSITFSALNDALPSGTRYYWVTVDLGADATGNINGSINNSSAITLSNGALGGSSCYGLLNAGGDPSLPVRLITFTANQHKYGVLLYWVTESQTDNLGFVLARRNNEEATWKSIASYKTDNALKGQGNSPDRAEYEFIDMNVKPEKTYYYRLSDVDVQGHVSTRGFAEIFVSDKLLPDETKLYPAFPNPFNALTRITYQLADEEKVTLSIFNITGRKIRNLSLDETQQQGLYSIIWDGKDVNGCNVPTGIYLIQLQAGSFTNTGKVLLLR